MHVYPYVIYWFIVNINLLFKALQKCTIIQVLIVHFDHAKVYNLDMLKCTLLWNKTRMLKNSVNNINAIISIYAFGERTIINRKTSFFFVQML